MDIRIVLPAEAFLGKVPPTEWEEVEHPLFKKNNILMEWKRIGRQDMFMVRFTRLSDFTAIVNASVVLKSLDTELEGADVYFTRRHHGQRYHARTSEFLAQVDKSQGLRIIYRKER